MIVLTINHDTVYPPLFYRFPRTNQKIVSLNHNLFSTRQCCSKSISSSSVLSLSLSLSLSLNSSFSTSSYTIYPIYLLLQDHSFLPSLKSFFLVRHVRNPISLQNRCEQILVYFDDEICVGTFLQKL